MTTEWHIYRMHVFNRVKLFVYEIFIDARLISTKVHPHYDILTLQNACCVKINPLNINERQAEVGEGRLSSLPYRDKRISM